jgi:hypothetical protein
MKAKKKRLTTWQEQVEKGFKCIEKPNLDFERNWKPNCTQYWEIMQIKGYIKWLLNKFV